MWESTRDDNGSHSYPRDSGSAPLIRGRAGAAGATSPGLFGPPNPSTPKMAAFAKLEAENFRQAGIGCFFNHEGKTFVVTNVTEGGAAQRCGLVQTEDVLQAIDGRAVTNWSLDTVKRAILGEYGTFVTLGFDRREADGSLKYFEARLMRGTPPWLDLYERYVQQGKGLEQAREQLLAVRHALATAEAESANALMEAERLRAMLQMTDEQLAKLRGEFQSETRRCKELESRTEHLEAAAKIDADELARLRKTLTEVEGDLTLARAVAEEYKEKSEHETALRMGEAQRRAASEQREAQAQKDLVAAHDARRNAEVALDESARRNSELSDTIEALRNQLEEETLKHQAAESRANDATAKCNELVSTLRRTEAQRDEVTSVLSVEKEQSTALASKAEKIDKDLSATKGQLHDCRRECKQRQSELDKARAAANKDAAEIARLNKLLDETVAEMGLAKTDVTQLQRLLAESASRIKALETNLGDATAEVARSQDETKAAHEAINTAKAATTAEATARGHAQDATEKAEAVAAELRAKLKKEENKLKEANKRMEAQRQEMAKQSAALSAESDKVFQANVQIEGLTGRCTALEQEVAEGRRSVEAIERDKDDLLSAHAKQHKEMQTAHSKALDEQEREKAQLAAGHAKEQKEARSAHDKALHKLKTDHDKQQQAIKAALHTEEQAKASAERHAAQLQETVNRNQQEMDRLVKLIDGLQADLSTARSEVLQYSTKNQEHTAAVQRITAAHEQSTQQIETLNTEISTLQRDLRAAEVREGRERDRADEAAARAQTLQEELKGAKEFADHLSSQLGQARAELDAEKRKRQLAEDGRSAAETEAKRLVEEREALILEVHEAQVATQREKERCEREVLAKAEAVAGEMRAKARAEESEATTRKLREKLEEQQRQLQELESQLKSLAATKARLEESLVALRKLEAELDAMRHARDKAEAELAAYFKLPDPCGVGMQVESDGTDMIVKQILPDQSCAKSGAVQAGDKLLAVDGRDTTGMSTAEVRTLIPGRRGSYVTLEFSRKGSEPFKVNLKRGSFGPEFHVVEPEPADGPVAGQSNPLPEPPTKKDTSRKSTGSSGGGFW